MFACLHDPRAVKPRQPRRALLQDAQDERIPGLADDVVGVVSHVCSQPMTAVSLTLPCADRWVM